MIRDGLRAARLGRLLRPASVRVFARLASTNLAAERLLAAREISAPAVVVTARQTAGRGRRANAWWSDGGSLCATFVLPAAGGPPPEQVPFRAALAVVGALETAVPRGVLRVKWPNDVYAEGRKLAGILCRRAGADDVIGIGINVTSDLRKAPEGVARRATTVAGLTRHPPSREDLLVALWRAMRDEWTRDDWHARYCELHLLGGRDVRVDCDGETVSGLCEAVAPTGHLVVRTPRGVRSIASGTIVT